MCWVTHLNIAAITHRLICILVCMKQNQAWGYKTFSCSIQLSMKFILLIIVDNLTCISMINTTSERLKARHFFICWYFSFYEQLKFYAQLSWAWKKFNNLWASFFRSSYSCTNFLIFLLTLQCVVMAWWFASVTKGAGEYISRNFPRWSQATNTRSESQKCSNCVVRPWSLTF